MAAERADIHHIQQEPLAQSDSVPSEEATVNNLSPNRERLLRDVIAPLDSYTEDGVYWADLPLGERVRDVLSLLSCLLLYERGCFGNAGHENNRSLTIRLFLARYISGDGSARRTAPNPSANGGSSGRRSRRTRSSHSGRTGGEPGDVACHS